MGNLSPFESFVLMKKGLRLTPLWYIVKPCPLNPALMKKGLRRVAKPTVLLRISF